MTKRAETFRSHLGCAFLLLSRYSKESRGPRMSSVSGLRKNSRLRSALGAEGVRFLEHAVAAVERILPHVELSRWKEVGGVSGKRGATWGDPSRRHIRLRLCFEGLGAGAGDPGDSNSRTVEILVSRRTAPTGVGNQPRTLDATEFDICNRVAKRIADVLVPHDRTRDGSDSLRAISALFDEHIVAGHLGQQHDFSFDVVGALNAVRGLSEQTYENRALAFGCVFDAGTGRRRKPSQLQFPRDFVRRKKFKALTDGFRTGFRVGADGALVRVLDLRKASAKASKGFVPEWAREIAGQGPERLALALTRSGDILLFSGGNLRFSYRLGRWQYWNHAHLIDIIKNAARAQHVPPRQVGAVAKRLYRIALDVSFRRSGGLLVLLRSRGNLSKVVRQGDGISDPSRVLLDRQLDEALENHSVLGLSERVIAELAGLDGALVVANNGNLLAYGAILIAARARLADSEGSRTRAARSASSWGLAIKISSDGDIAVYKDQKALVTV